MKAAIAAVLVSALLGAVVAALVVGLGVYDVSALNGHTQPVFRLLETAMRRSVSARAESIAVPPLDGQTLALRGAACYRDHCVQCHGAPGQAPGDLGKSLEPLPGPLVDAARRWRPNELYWITRHGLKMTGMPAWALRLPENDLWALTAFLQRLPETSPAAYRGWMAQAQAQSCRSVTSACQAGDDDCPRAAADAASAPLAQRDEAARVALRQYACIGCHQVPGVAGPKTGVGPPLQGLWRRERIAGGLPNQPDTLVQWIRHPQAVKSDTAMPDLGVTEADARLMAHYLLHPR